MSVLHCIQQSSVSRQAPRLGHARTQPCTCISSPAQALRLLPVAAFSAGGAPCTPAPLPQRPPPPSEVPAPEPVSRSFLSQSSQFPALPTPEPSRFMLQPRLSSYHPPLQPLIQMSSGRLTPASCCPGVPQPCCWTQSPLLQDAALQVKSLGKQHPDVCWENPLDIPTMFPPCERSLGSVMDAQPQTPAWDCCGSFVVPHNHIPVPSGVPRSCLI